MKKDAYKNKSLLMKSASTAALVTAATAEVDLETKGGAMQTYANPLES